MGGAKADRKHDRRRIFHAQMKRLWTVNSLLANWRLKSGAFDSKPALEILKEKYTKFGSYNFVPLITKDISVETALHFHILRSTTFKGQNADPDNIVKILVDSLKMPQDAGELPNNAIPTEDEKPFFVLMQDDGLISKIVSTSDELLQPIDEKKEIERSDTRVMINVHIRPNYPKSENLIFFSDDSEIWNHQWDYGLEGIRGWSNSDLKARATQCILRMRVTASNFRMQSRGRFPSLDMNEYNSIHDEQHMIWNSRLRPLAMVLKDEMERRIYSEPPYPNNGPRMFAIEHGRLTGPDPIGEAADGLESLVRQLP